MKNTLQKISGTQLEDIVSLFSPYMDDCLYVMDLKEDFYKISKHAVERFMLPSDSFYNAAEMHQHFVYEKDRPLIKAELEEMLNGTKKFHNLHYRWLDKNGHPIWINCRGGVIDDENGKPRYLIGCINETGKKQRADNNSGLLSDIELSTYIMSHISNISSGFVMNIGIVDFGLITANMGMEYGDYIIKSVAYCISQCLTDGQQLFHTVADEYMLVDFGNHSSEDAIILYNNIREKISEFIDLEHYKSVFTISVGIIDAVILADGYENFFKKSDFTLRKAKKYGNNNYYIFNYEDYDMFLRKRTLIKQLHNAVENNFEGFEVFYQPIVDCITGKLVGAEALMRFSIESDNKKICISPMEFIPLLEETSLIVPAGRWILNEAASMCNECQKFIKGFKINVNISYVQLIKSDILKDILSVIETNKIAPECLGIELTESGYIDANTHFQELRNGLKEHGILFIIDDFGTGYSNLHCLSDLSPTYIKIDRTFTNKAMCNTYDHELLIKIIEMAHTLNLQICVEGVEKTEVLEDIRSINADFIQGYLFGKPCCKMDFYNNYF